MDAIPYSIESSEAWVACATTSCWQCGAEIEVIAIYCVSGMMEAEPLKNFSVIHIDAIDDALRAQLVSWSFFKRNKKVFCNHCSYCSAVQEDLELHCEPDGVFFQMDAASLQSMKLIPLTGRIRLNGEETFGG